VTQVLTIARLTILEASRRKLLLALGILTVVVIVLTSWGFSRLPTMSGVTPAEVRLASSQLTILVAFMFSGVLALGSTLVAAPSIASDIESGIALAILPRPIRRSQLLMGKWLGLALLVTVYAAGSGLLELLGIWLATGYTPPSPLAALSFVAAEGIVLMTLALLLSTRLAPMTGGVIALVLFFVAWIGGIALAIGQTFGNDTIINNHDSGVATEAYDWHQRIDLGRAYPIIPGLLSILRNIDRGTENIVGRAADSHGVCHPVQTHKRLVQGFVGEIR